MSSTPGQFPGNEPQRSGGRASMRRNMRYDDDDDFNDGQPRIVEGATSAGMIGFIFALVSVGLLVVVAVLWALLDQDQAQARNVEQKRWLLYWFLFLDILSFFAALVATILGTRGLTPTNPLYRGFSLTSLILGLLEIVVTIIFGIFMTCLVAFFQAFGL